MYISDKRLEFEKTYETLLAKISEDVSELEATIEELTIWKNDNYADYLLENSKPVGERDADYIADRLAKVESNDNRLARLDGRYELLSETQNNLLDNPDFFIERITVARETRLADSKEFNLRNTIIYSLIIGLVAAFIITFIVAVAAYARYARKH
jgi:hypothetical protein